MGKDEMSTRSRIVCQVMNHFTNDLAIGKKIKNGDIRKNLIEPKWKVPDHLTLTQIDRDHFTMYLMSCKVNPSTDKVFLLVHGGGYIGAMRNIYYSFGTLLNEASHGCNVLIPDYRVAPKHRYPAAIEDCLEAYQWLLDRGYFGSQIILVGDSAGGGLVLSMTHYLRDHHLPLPCGIIAMSPWTDVTASGDSYTTNYESDVLFGKTRESMIYDNPYIGLADPMHPYLSPKFGDFHDFPPMLIQVAGTEMLLSDSVDVAEKARAQHVRVRISVYEGMFHVFQMALLALPESRKAWAEIGRFIEILMEEE